MATKILTIGIPEETWKKIKRIAALQGKSVSALVREQIEKFLGEENRYIEVHKKISAIAEKNRGVLERWKREGLCRLQGAFYGGPFSWNEDSRGRNSESLF
jgi:predicted DNA-binding protein